MSKASLVTADVLTGLSSLTDESVGCIVTSPPYFGLRDYGLEGQIGLEPSVAEYGDTMAVLDPFSGSGSTGVAALQQGHDYIGIELSAEYNGAAEKRLRNALPCVILDT